MAMPADLSVPGIAVAYKRTPPGTRLLHRAAGGFRLPAPLSLRVTVASQGAARRLNRSGQAGEHFLALAERLCRS